MRNVIRPSPIPTPPRASFIESANGVEAAQDGRIHIKRINAPFLAAGGSGDDFRAGIERAVTLGWRWLHESRTYLKFTEVGAALL